MRTFQRPLVQKVFPQLYSEFIAADLVPFILPSVFYIAGLTNNDEFAAVVLPQLAPIFALERPYQVSLLVSQNFFHFI